MHLLSIEELYIIQMKQQGFYQKMGEPIFSSYETIW
jgi:hypothetical protein